MNIPIGALWIKHTDDMDYFSGVIQDLHGEIRIAVFPNNNKTSERQPDFNIVISSEKKQQEQPPLIEPEKKNGRKKKEEAPF